MTPVELLFWVILGASLIVVGMFLWVLGAAIAFWRGWSQ